MSRRSPSPPLLGRLLLRLCRLGDRRDDVRADMQELFETRLATLGRKEARGRFNADGRSVWLRPPAQTPRPWRPRPRWSWVTDIPGDVAYGVRVLRRQTSVMTMAIAGLAVALGMANSVFAVNNAFNLKPLGVPHAARTVRVGPTFGDGDLRLRSWTYAEFLTASAAAQTAILEGSVSASVSVSRTADHASAPSVGARFVTPTFLDTFGASTLLGRSFASSDSAPGAPPVAVLNHAYWRTHFGADRNVVGQNLFINQAAVRIIGVLHESFTGPFRADQIPALWLPLEATTALASWAGPFTPPSGVPIDVVALLGREQGAHQTELELSAIAGVDVRANAAGSEFTTDAFLLLLVFLTIVALVVVLAAANVANLLLASASSRAQELRTRLAIGAARSRLVRMLLTESLVLGAVAGVAAIWVATWMSRLILAVSPMPASTDLSPDWRVYLFAAVIAAAAGLASGVSPALQATGGNVPRAVRTRSWFLGIQAATSVMLLVLTALFSRALVVAADQPLTFDPDRLIRINASAPREGGEMADRDFYPASIARLMLVPGVSTVSLAEHPPFDSSFHPISSTLDGRPYRLLQNRTDTSYFDVVGVSLLKGRMYTADEVTTGAKVAVITSDLEADFWPDDVALGATLDRVSPEYAGVRVIGVVPDTAPKVMKARYASAPTVYLPITQQAAARIVVRTADEAPALVSLAQQVVVALDPRRTTTARLLSDDFARQLEGPRMAATVAGVVGAVALCLAIAGVYGVTAVVVIARRRDIGIRLAIGASRGQVVFAIFRECMRPIAFGLVCGLVLAALGAQVLAFALFAGVSPRDPLAFASAAGVLVLATVAGVFLPSRGAASVDPVESLRAE